MLAIHPGWMRTEIGGPDADLSVDEAAESIICLIENSVGRLNEAVFVDNTGEPLNY